MIFGINITRGIYAKYHYKSCYYLYYYLGKSLNYRPDHLERVIEQEQDLLYDSNLWANYCPSKNLTNHTKTAF